MENKRKAKINKYFTQLVEEKSDLVDLVDKNVNQVYCGIEIINNGDLNQKDLHNFIEYELKLIQKLEEFSYELETLLDECPIKPIHAQEYEDSANTVGHSRETPTQMVMVTTNSTYNSSIAAEIPTHDNEVSGVDLQNALRQTLKAVGEKLGLNDQNISSIRDFYSKPISTHISGFDDVPSISTVRYVPEDYYPNGKDNYQIPEKDHNPCSHIDSTLDDTNTNSDHLEQAQINCELDTNNIEADSSEESSDYLDIASSNNHNNVPGFRNYNEPCSAIEKLNNLKLTESMDSHFDMKPMELPDLTLKPINSTEITIQKATVIRNFETKNKKEKKKNNNLYKTIFDLKPKAVPEEGSVCAFSHIESPSDFYIHLVDNESSLIDKISEDIKKIALNRRKYKTKHEAYNDIDKYGIVFIPDYDNWYRMEVLNWYNMDQQPNVLVRLVDFGSKHEVSFENLGRLTKSLADIPMLAVHCHFPVMYPPNSTALNKLTQWPEDTIAALMEISGLLHQGELRENLFKIEYCWNPGLDSPLEIDLIHIDRQDEEHTVGQTLLNLGLAVQIENDYEEGEGELAEFLQDVDILERDENINEAITGYDARDEARICRFTKPDGTCYKGKNCKLEHVLLPKDGYTSDREEVFKEAMYSLLLPRIGEYVMVLITGYKNVCNFFVQIIRNPVAENRYLVDHDFKNLMQDINSPKMLKSYECFKVAPAIGEIVLVKHWSSRWYRGVVRDCTTNPDGEPFRFQVFIVDFGETLLNIKPSDLRKIKPNYLQLPFQAVECYIKEYEFNKSCKPIEAKRFFDKNMYFYNFMATTFSSTLPFGIILQTKNGLVNVGQSLSQKGFAIKRTIDLNPSEDCLLQCV